MCPIHVAAEAVHYCLRPAGTRVTTTVDQQEASRNGGSASRHVPIAILGAGFGGLGMAIRLKQEGVDDFIVFERDTDVGGTWWANSYPGCQCDIPSHLYSYSFAPNPNWTRTYPLQEELGRYARDCATRFGVLDHIRLGCEVSGAQWDEAANRWRIETSDGEFTADVLIAAPGFLSEPSIPALPGLDDLRGHGLPHRALEPRPRPHAGGAWRCSERAPPRSRPCPGSSRSSSTWGSSSARRRG